MDVFGCEISTILLYIIGICVAIYLYGKWRNRVFHNTGIPGPAPDIYIGNLREISKICECICNTLTFKPALPLGQDPGPGFTKRSQPKMIGLNVTEIPWRKRYGDVFGLYLGSVPAINVFDLDILKEVFVKNFQNFTDRLVLDLNPYPVNMGLFFEKGAEWQRLRNILSPTFTAGKLRLMCDHLNRASETLTNKLVVSAEKQEIVDVKDQFGGFTMDAIASTAFGIHVDSQADLNNPFVAYAKKLFDLNILEHPLVLLGTIFPSLNPLLRLFGVYLFPRDAVQFFVKTVHQMIEERKRSTPEEQSKNKDFLQLLMNAEDNTVQNGAPGTPHKSKKMSKDEIFAQAFLFFAAGYETTASTLQYISYALATNPEIQQRLIDEIQANIGDDEPTYENIQSLKLLDNVIQETLRMYPPVPGVTRMTKETVNIKGYTFPKGSAVFVMALPLQRDPELFPDPNTFKPDRWDGADKNPISWLPFGYGPRLCIGMRLAQVELKIVLIHILRRVKFVRLPDTPDVIEFKTSGLLIPKVPIKLRAELI